MRYRQLPPSLGREPVQVPSPLAPPSPFQARTAEIATIPATPAIAIAGPTLTPELAVPDGLIEGDAADCVAELSGAELPGAGVVCAETLELTEVVGPSDVVPPPCTSKGVTVS